MRYGNVSLEEVLRVAYFQIATSQVIRNGVSPVCGMPWNGNAVMGESLGSILLF